MNSLSMHIRKGRPRISKDKNVNRNRDDESPMRHKEESKSTGTSAPTASPAQLIIGSFLVLIVAYFYYRDTAIGGDLLLDATALPLSTSRNVTHFKVLPALRQQQRGDSNSETETHSTLKFVTIVMPSVVNPKNRKQRLEAIAETWGPASRSIYVLHNAQEEYPNYDSIRTQQQGEMDVVWPQILELPPNITFDDGLPRLYYTIQHVFQKFSKAQFFFFVNDHTYVIPEHLCRYLIDHHPDPNRTLYAGHALKNTEREIFNSGAAGYILSHASMEQLVNRFHIVSQRQPLGENCLVDANTKWLQKNPGLVTAKCLQHSLNTVAIDTRENHKYHRFHAFSLVRMVMGTVDEWYIKKHADIHKIMLSNKDRFDESYSNLLSGEECCSSQTISFHYVEASEHRALYKVRQALIQTKNPDSKISDDELKMLLVNHWPKDRHEIGYYSRGLPADKDVKTWTDLLAVVRKMSQPQDGRQC